MICSIFFFPIAPDSKHIRVFPVGQLHHQTKYWNIWKTHEYLNSVSILYSTYFNSGGNKHIKLTCMQNQLGYLQANTDVWMECLLSQGCFSELQHVLRSFATAPHGSQCKQDVLSDS